MRKIFYSENQGTMYYRFMKKIRDQKSHATVPLTVCYSFKNAYVLYR